ncbi:hypothetical protein EIU82_07275 [Salmonella enterica]|uniref:Uncharacterized protein n=5 Tax=Salmonella enterica TaxID=28901 RepID=A0A5Z1MZF4_SALET|nr:hypothetical protein [Salmonella enterica]EAR0075357.1 hypothetical protein [Salmonella enterica subsp. enterica serovar Muenchen]EAU5224632.1 hypothetical protein [Salmonella enterica subsp. enterica serovar Oranienburg]EAW2201513.1 hypothetical protein [Salmonella enterica subsp. enterica]EBG0251112.1 hypothetical protein [Salmonella enterica subsp. enterica serovar Typhi]EBG7955270.1 hypothetical protein [Salmonella enterica subsp. enterica serovar Heidelberg]ECG1401386.1 hypothetical p
MPIYHSIYELKKSGNGRLIQGNKRKLILERSAKCVQRIKCHDEPPLQLLRMRKRGYSNTEI